MSAYGNVLKDHDNALANAVAFLEGRYRAMYEDKGIAVDIIQSVQIISPTSPRDFNNGIIAVQQLVQSPYAKSLIESNKRIVNILKANPNFEQGFFNFELATEEAERNLFNAMSHILTKYPLLVSSDYISFLTDLTELADPLDTFFKDVMVISDNPDLRTNRLRLLAQLRGLFTSVADISVLQH